MNKKYWECTITIDDVSHIEFDNELLKLPDDNFGRVDLDEMYRKISIIVARLKSKGHNVVATNIKHAIDCGWLDGDTTYVIRVVVLNK